MQLPKIELNNSQVKQISILEAVDKICKKNGITYCLAYGTLLGAIRHHGFIPWDNDIDIMMTRKEHYKLIKALKECKDLYIYPISYNSIETAGLSRIALKESSNNTEIHIDAFILDSLKSSPFLGAKLKYGKFLSIAKLSKYEKNFLYNRFSLASMKGLIIRISDLYRIFLNSQNVEKHMYKLIVSKDDDEDTFILLEDVTKPITHDSIFPLKTAIYEGKEYPIPNNADIILKLWYGDYMRIPEEGIRYLNNLNRT